MPIQAKNMNKIKFTENQEQLACSIIENDVTFCHGPAGSGKSLVSLMVAANQINLGNFDKLVVSRTLVNVGQPIGSLPGSLVERSDPYFEFAVIYLKELFGKDYQKFLKDEKIKLIATEMVRGMTFDKTIMIIEECQNASSHQIKSFITRMGKGSKCIVLGDIGQKDTDRRQDNGLQFCLDHFSNGRPKGVGVVQLGYEDIKRNNILADIIRVFDQGQEAQRNQ